MKTTIQTLLTALVVAVIAISGASSITSCSKKSDPTPTTTLTFPGINSFSAIVLGDQANTNPSYVILTSGTRVSSSNFSSSVDLDFATTPQATPSTPQLISPDLRASFGFTTNTVGGSVTYIGSAPSSVSFANLRQGQLDSLSTPATKNVSLFATGTTPVSSGTLFVFQTASGKKGLINISSVAYTPSSTANTVQFDIKVQQ